ncbi:MAG: hypothetical protein NWR30_01590 [Salibacteraceae bacterium]|nr:hypothetical protein [Salibacteraceae bacterium]
MHQEQDFYSYVEERKPSSPRAIFDFLYDLAELPRPELLLFENPSELLNQLNQYESRSVFIEASSVSRSIALAVIEQLAKPQINTITAAFNYETIKEKRAEKWQLPALKYTDGILNTVIEHTGLPRSAISLHPHTDDLAWMAFITSFKELKINEKLSQYFNLLKQMPLLSICTKTAVYCLDWPMKSTFNQNWLLHHESDAALKFTNDSIYVWKGVSITSKLFISPNEVTKNEIISEQNAERRRCYLEILGAEKFANLLELDIRHSEIDAKGNLQVLYRSRDKDLVAKEFLQFAKVVCPSTQREYFLCVPAYLNNCTEAVAWTFGKTPENYKPDVET